MRPPSAAEPERATNPGPCGQTNGYGSPVRRTLVILTLLAAFGLSGCGQSAAERTAKLRHDADQRLAVVTDCRLIVVAWAAARDKRTRAEADDRARRAKQKRPRTETVERAEVEVDAIVARAQQLGCSGVSS